MNSLKIENSVLDVYRKCNIKSFPFNYRTMLSTYGIKCISYSTLPVHKRKACMTLSSDACFIKDTVYYNPDKPSGRIRFSIMHELGHLILNSHEESDANLFASYILAPRMAVHYSKCLNSFDVSKKFKITLEASGYAFNSYLVWYRYVQRYKMRPIDKEYYYHFYDKENKKFIYHINICTRCQTRPTYNYADTCSVCSQIYQYNDFSEIDGNYNYKIAEQQWLYSTEY